MLAKLADIGSRMFPWVEGQRFPPGFDAWCESAVGPPLNGFSKHEKFSDFVKTRYQNDWGEVASTFISSVTEPHTHWESVIIDPQGDYIKSDLKLDFPEEDRSKVLGNENTHALRLEVHGVFRSLECANLRVQSCALRPETHEPRIRLVNCLIGNLHLRGEDRAYKNKSNLELHDCWIGTLILPSKSVGRLSVTGGGIAQIKCPSSDSENPFTGAVSFKEVFLPSSPGQTRLFQGPHAYRSLYAHLKKLDNALMANQMRSLQLRAERVDEHDRFSRFTNWIYGTFANYGMSPGRPIWWLCCAYFLAVIGCYYFDPGMLVQSGDFYVGAYSTLLDENGGRCTRSILLPLHSITNPFGVFFDTRKLIVPITGWGSLLLTLQGLFSDILLVMTVLSIRRRFKAE
ncbi:MAG: hypothetical protein A4E19_12240 [Nitrospira sp. SG-bin1]|nr:MAG: hypothetical protein A4E19_12240 [Nitrospira sp. SG-bin1]